jgi:hypothetical protein
MKCGFAGHEVQPTFKKGQIIGSDIAICFRTESEVEGFYRFEGYSIEIH